MWFEETEGIFVKSLPDHGLWLNGLDQKGNLVIKQATQDIFKNMTLKPNTQSFWLPERLSFSFLFHRTKILWFKESYRNNGVIFKYREWDKQDYFLPCDMLAITSCLDIPANKNEVLQNIQKYYTQQIIKHWNYFASEEISTTLMRMHHFQLIWWTSYEPADLIREFINSFRESRWYKSLSLHHNWLTSYNECIKFSPLKIDILGAFWKSKNIIDQAKQYNVPVYDGIEHFLAQDRI